jgi:hypothetical protein
MRGARGADAWKWSMEKLESKGRFPLCPQTRLLLLPSSPEDAEESCSDNLLHLEFVPAHPALVTEREHGYISPVSHPRTEQAAEPHVLYQGTALAGPYRISAMRALAPEVSAFLRRVRRSIYLEEGGPGQSPAYSRSFTAQLKSGAGTGPTRNSWLLPWGFLAGRR